MDLDRISSAAQDAEIFASAVKMLIARHDVEARAILATLTKDDPIASPQFPTSLAIDPHPSKEKALSRAVKAGVYERDGWRCRYCTRKLIVPGILSLLTYVCPGFKGLLPGHHMPYDRTEPAVERVYPNVDHILPLSGGGSCLDDNLATACTKCNAKKSSWLGWQPGPSSPDEWDGLKSAYRALADRHDDDVWKTRRYHLDWFRALSI